jgi:drug/metabolite transporter (DMT)-like permease
VSVPFAPALTPIAMIILALCVAAEISRELLFKVAADAAAARPGYAVAIARSPLAWAGVALWLIEIVGWVAALQRVPLNVAFSVITLCYAGVPVAAALLLKERLVKRQMAGAALIVMGVLCVGLSGRAA